MRLAQLIILLVIFYNFLVLLMIELLMVQFSWHFEKFGLTMTYFIS